MSTLFIWEIFQMPIEKQLLERNCTFLVTKEIQDLSHSTLAYKEALIWITVDFDIGSSATLDYCLDIPLEEMIALEKQAHDVICKYVLNNGILFSKILVKDYHGITINYIDNIDNYNEFSNLLRYVDAILNLKKQKRINKRNDYKYNNFKQINHFKFICDNASDREKRINMNLNLIKTKQDVGFNEDSIRISPRSIWPKNSKHIFDVNETKNRNLLNAEVSKLQNHYVIDENKIISMCDVKFLLSLYLETNSPFRATALMDIIYDCYGSYDEIFKYLIELYNVDDYKINIVDAMGYLTNGRKAFLDFGGAHERHIDMKNQLMIDRYLPIYEKYSK